MPDYPECDKMAAVKDKSQAIGEFLEWLQDTKRVQLALWADRGELNPLRAGSEELLAEYFGIDLKKVEQEKQAMLKDMRKRHAKPSHL